MHYYYFYQSAMVLSLVASAASAVLIWRRRQVPGAVALMALSIATFVWTLGFYLESNSVTLGRQLFFNNIGYLGSMSVPVAWFFFALNYAAGNRRLNGWRIFPFGIVPLVTTVLVWTNSLHHLMWFDEHLITSGPFTVTAKTYGMFFWIAAAHNYVLIVTGTIILIRRLFIGVPLYRGQAVSLLAAAILPLIWNFIYVFNLTPLPHKDLTPVMFAISGIVIILGLMRFHLLATVPLNRKFLIERLNTGILAFDMHGHLLEANQAALTAFGLDKNAVGKKVEPPSTLMPVLKRLSAAGPGSLELPLKNEAEERFYELETAPMLDNRDRQVGWLAILRDVTERKRLELEYRTIIQTTVDGFWISDLEGRFLDVNDAYCRFMGYSRDELLNMKIFEVEASEKPEETAAHIARIKQAGKDRFETRHRRKGGSVIDFEISVNYTPESGGRMFVFTRDITERKRMQDQLITQDRLASIGELTAGIAHELNNPLTSVIGFSELLGKRDVPPEIAADLKIINSEAERAAKVVDNLLTFARKQQKEKSPGDINKTIAKALELRAYEQKVNNIRTVTRFASNLPEVMGSAFQLEQVFINIIINAEYFMTEAHGKGILTIVTEPVGDFVRIAFKDDGPGIPRENLKHIFDPFFTTKGTGKGTGLGLSICHGIITEHGGRIWAESRPGDGAAFIIELPVYKREGLEGG